MKGWQHALYYDSSVLAHSLSRSLFPTSAPLLTVFACVVYLTGLQAKDSAGESDKTADARHWHIRPAGPNWPKL
jgi:hypothetical protein